mmetsp:Transcript_12450/g.17278  ORF Transcript_12450/g.17278 Transcript_12450/m.17278 type:complete len:167 (+) Transcript_12450:189-689(+)|eukprot:CAMPEP_0184481516 /NCGR_PEP_ID=MMETSP0113_2-20130426/3071_1 /TAXON_ID=91329 /ORGANISM="Norrisiella sphaerica, Strain BC52" /LENGTH=166 /DNA_ID=CAMNT_0026860687 /DNA_START=158 /DNA_END=658 /DNA_ORIENTATION=-
MLGSAKINANPTVYRKEEELEEKVIRADVEDEDTPEPFDALEIFELIRNINDPEHPLTLEQLRVAQLKDIYVDNKNSHIKINFTPTIPHCSMATLIGLSLRVKLLRSLPPRFKVDIAISPGTHNQEVAVNKQLNDKERVAAALENENLLAVVDKCLKPKDSSAENA